MYINLYFIVIGKVLKDVVVFWVVDLLVEKYCLVVLMLEKVVNIIYFYEVIEVQFLFVVVLNFNFGQVGVFWLVYFMVFYQVFDQWCYDKFYCQFYFIVWYYQGVYV